MLSDAGQAGGGGCGDVGAGVQAEPAEQGGGVGAQGVVGPGEHGPYIGGGVVGREGIQSAGGVAQFGGQPGERELGAGGGAGGGDGQREGQPGAAGDDLADRGGLGRDPAGAEPGGQQVTGLARGEQVQAEGAGAFGGDQASEPAAAGDQGQAAGRAG